jgi:hypothetical protein
LPYAARRVRSPAAFDAAQTFKNRRRLDTGYRVAAKPGESVFLQAGDDFLGV